MPSPFDTVNTVLNTARVRVNDAIVSIGGEVLTDNAAFTLVYVNAAWRRLQEFLANAGFAAFTNETFIPNIPITGTADVGAFSFINWFGFSNGATTGMSPVLPGDLIAPMALWERKSGGSTYYPVDQILGGLPTVPKDVYNRMWEWRDQNIYFPGATVLTDLRIRYKAYMLDFVDNSPLPATPWYNQLVPIQRCLNAFAWGICSEFSKARGDLDAGYFDQQAQISATMIYNADAQNAYSRSIMKTSENGRMVDQYTPELDGNPMPQRGKK
jgi:hypothetical protein